MKKITRPKLKIALVYDWLDTQFGGAEYVLQSLLMAFPQATLFTTTYNPRTSWVSGFAVRSSFIDKIPLIKDWRPTLALLSPLAFETLDLADFDIIISVTSFAAKAVITHPRQVHVSYLLSPPRFVYRLADSYLAQEVEPMAGLLNLLAQPFVYYLKRFDQVADYRPDFLISLSRRVKQQVLSSSGRQVTAICYPPVASQNAQPDAKLATTLPQHYFLSVGRLVPYKRVDLAIKSVLATGKLLLIVGSGSDYDRLLALAGNAGATREEGQSLTEFMAKSHGKSILFIHNCEPRELATLYQKADALISLGEEDFGLTPLEAASVGTLAIINGKSGVSEVLPENLAIHVKSLRVENISTAIDQVANFPVHQAELKAQAATFSQDKFISYWQSWVEHATNV